MKRSASLLLSGSLLLLLGPAAFAQETKDDWKWEPLKQRTPVVGDRWFQVDEETQASRSKATVGDKAPKIIEDRQTLLKYRVVHETLAVDAKKVSKERITVERWLRQTDPKAPEDKSLTGKSFLVERSATAKTKVTFEDTVGVVGSWDDVSQDGKDWAEKSLARTDPMDQIDKLFPKAPVEPDGEWSLDPEKLAAEIWEGTPIDAQKSSAKGTLKNVRVEDDVRQGDVEIKILLQLKQVPSAPVEWKDGGLVDLTVTITGSLEPEKDRKRSVKMELKLNGRAEQDSKDGKLSVKIDMKMATSITSGDMPKK